MLLYHVTPMRNMRAISLYGLVSHMPSGLEEHYEEPMVFLFEDGATAMDALENWLVDLYDRDRFFALIKVVLPDNLPVYRDPRLFAGGFMVPAPIPASAISLVDIIDAGESD
jgi:hypothetical protein